MQKEWRCKECGTLLGVVECDSLILRYKQMEYIVSEGKITAVCRKCRKANVMKVCERKIKAS